MLVEEVEALKFIFPSEFFENPIKILNFVG
jgi:hypothetical protein